MVCEYYNHNNIEFSYSVELKDSFKLLEKAHIAAMKEMVRTEKDHVLYGITIYDKEDNIEKQLIFRNVALSNEELDEYIEKFPRAIFHVVHSGSRSACKKIIERQKNREIRPITLKTANEYVNRYHRHHNGTVGCKFAVGLFEGEKLIGVAICGRPVSRMLDNGEVCEINRLCTQGGENACSMLYGACCRIAKDMGYKKIITYILESESGITLRASNFTCEGIAGGTHWSGQRNRGQNIPHEMKTRWGRVLNS